jgi:hypothetical protein
MTATTTNNGRTFTLTAEPVNADLTASLQSRGFDGTVWFGQSTPVGRQRGTKHAMFYRTVDGRFVFVTEG